MSAIDEMLKQEGKIPLNKCGIKQLGHGGERMLQFLELSYIDIALQTENAVYVHNSWLPKSQLRWNGNKLYIAKWLAEKIDEPSILAAKEEDLTKNLIF